MSKRLRILALVVAMVVLALALGNLGAHSGRRAALRNYVAELKGKGERLTYAELEIARLTNSSDSHAVVANTALLIKGGPVTPGLVEVRSYVAPGRALVAWQQPSPISGKSNTWEELDAQMQASDSAFQEVRDALKTPSADAGPYTNMFVGRRVNFVAIRIVAQWLTAAAENDLHRGRLEAALQKIEALAGLSNMERDEPTLVAQMIRVAVAGLGLAVTWEALQAPGWSDPHLDRLQKAWERVDMAGALERGFEGARASGYELFTRTRHLNGPQVGRLLAGTSPPSSTPAYINVANSFRDYIYIPLYKLTSLDQDELFYLRNMQEGLTALRQAKAHRPWAETRQRLNQVNSNVTAMAGSPQRVRYLFSTICIPNYLKACDTGMNNETERQMALAAIALKRFQLRHGELPATLEGLVPDFLPALPYDYMAARPLRYARKADGTYLLYSVGRDGQDDGGDPQPAPGLSNGIWSGRDAVWPRPAAAAGGQSRPSTH